MKDVLKIFIPVYNVIFAWRISSESDGGYTEGHGGLLGGILIGISAGITLAFFLAIALISVRL